VVICLFFAITLNVTWHCSTIRHIWCSCTILIAMLLHFIRSIVVTYCQLIQIC